MGVARGRWLIASMAQQKAAAQLGTVGSGNYYVDLLRDEGWGQRLPGEQERRDAQRAVRVVEHRERQSDQAEPAP